MMDAPSTILIADDDPIGRKLIQTKLFGENYKLIFAADGREALDKIKEVVPDLVLLDNILPGKTGWEVTREVKQDEQYREIADTPIIMFSAMDDVEDKVEGFELGIEDYITKPFNFSEVLARIQAVLRQHELSRQVARRERRLTLVESLRNSLLYFTKHIKEPIGGLLTEARDLDAGDQSAVEAFARRIVEEAKQTLASIEGLEEEVAELQNKDNVLKADEVSLEELEKKYRKHFQLEIGQMQEAES